MNNTQTTIHIDGGSRGNPGLAAYAYTIVEQNEAPIEFAATIERATNNVAEYSALVAALNRASELRLQKLEILSDSELLVKQMNGEYRVKHPDLLPFFQDATRLRRQFQQVTIKHIRREHNKRTDQLCNEAMDKIEKKAKQETAKNSPNLPQEPRKPVSDAKVREDAVICLLTAAQTWSSEGMARLKPEMVWDQLWSLLEENSLLKVPKK